MSDSPASDRLRIAILAAGAAGMYCGSCLRDNALAAALVRARQRVLLVPLYTPLRTDADNTALDQVFYGGVNVYLQYASPLFRHTPRFVDWIFDRPWLLNFAGTRGAQTSPARLGPFILSILRRDDSPHTKELARLVRFLRSDLQPQVVSLPNAMFVALAEPLKRELNCAIVCELTGEDVFLDAMAEPYRTQARDEIRRHAPHVSRFIATSVAYADRMAHYLDIHRDRIDVIYPSVSRDFLAGDEPRTPCALPTVGYFARICPEKGLDRLIDALGILRHMAGLHAVQLRAAGYLGLAHRAWFEHLQQRIIADGLADAFEYIGETDLDGKRRFLDSIDVLSVPATHPEAKGIYVLESLARKTPVVQPASGAFPELLHATGGGILVPPSNPTALAEGIASLLLNPARRHALGTAGRNAIASAFTDDHMATRTLRAYHHACKG